jgi:hypothetical protein
MYSLENAGKPLIPKDGQVGIFMLPGEAAASSTEYPRILDWNLHSDKNSVDRVRAVRGPKAVPDTRQ